jgi:hypothetical protein
MPPISKNNFSAGSGIDARTLQIGGGLAQVVERPICMLFFVDVVTEWLT